MLHEREVQKITNAFLNKVKAFLTESAKDDATRGPVFHSLSFYNDTTATTFCHEQKKVLSLNVSASSCIIRNLLMHIMAALGRLSTMYALKLISAQISKHMQILPC